MPLDPVTAGLDLAKTVVQTIWPDETDQEKARLAAALALVQGQIDINKAEASSPSLFTSGWRPWVGWVCGMAFAWNWIGLPIGNFISAYAGAPVELSPADMGEMLPVLLGMLGLGGLRTFERIKGVVSPGR